MIDWHLDSIVELCEPNITHKSINNGCAIALEHLDNVICAAIGRQVGYFRHVNTSDRDRR
jgi:hypothetical protein